MIKSLRIIAALVAFLTFLWVVFMVAGMSVTGEIYDIDGVIDFYNNAHSLFYLTYINAALFTLFTVYWFSFLYNYEKNNLKTLFSTSVIFIPIYGTLNLIAYTSQITVLPYFLENYSENGNYIYSILANTFSQLLPGSFISSMNILAYAILGIPSILLGWYYIQNNKKLFGTIFSLNGVFCIVGFIGVILNNNILIMGTSFGGLLFLISLIIFFFTFKIPDLKKHDKN